MMRAYPNIARNLIIYLKMKSFFNDKNGSGSQDAFWQTFFFVVLNIVFILAILYFATNEVKGSAVYEQGFAKEIALMIDNSRPGMLLFVDISKGKEIAEKNGYKGELVRIDNAKNQLTVQLSNKNGYTFSYFSNYNLTYKDIKNGNHFTIQVEAKK